MTRKARPKPRPHMCARAERWSIEVVCWIAADPKSRDGLALSSGQSRDIARARGVLAECPMRFSPSSRVTGGVVAFGLVLAVASACGSEVDPHYGPAGGLAGKTTPAPSAGDGGSGTPPSGGGDAGGGTPSALCGGKGPVDGGSCGTATWTKIYAQMNGAWKCTDAGCHGKGVSSPTIDPASSHNAYMTLVGYAKINATPYINPCSTDPAKAMFVCNVGKPACGSLQMPVLGSGATALTAQDMSDLNAWVSCGSPEN